MVQCFAQLSIHITAPLRIAIEIGDIWDLPTSQHLVIHTLTNRSHLWTVSRFQCLDLALLCWVNLTIKLITMVLRFDGLIRSGVTKVEQNATLL